MSIFKGWSKRIQSAHQAALLLASLALVPERLSSKVGSELRSSLVWCLSISWLEVNTTVIQKWVVLFHGQWKAKLKMGLFCSCLMIWSCFIQRVQSWCWPITNSLNSISTAIGCWDSLPKVSMLELQSQDLPVEACAQLAPALVKLRSHSATLAQGDFGVYPGGEDMVGLWGYYKLVVCLSRNSHSLCVSVCVCMWYYISKLLKDWWMYRKKHFSFSLLWISQTATNRGILKTTVRLILCQWCPATAAALLAEPDMTMQAMPTSRSQHLSGAVEPRTGIVANLARLPGTLPGGSLVSARSSLLDLPQQFSVLLDRLCFRWYCTASRWLDAVRDRWQGGFRARGPPAYVALDWIQWYPWCGRKSCFRHIGLLYCLI